MMQKRLPEAIDLLCQVIDVAPDLGYLPWLLRWCQPEVITRLGWDVFAKQVVRSVLRAGIRVPPKPDADDPRLVNVRAGADLFAALRSAYPNEVVLYFGEATLRRRLADPNATLAVALEGVRRFPQDWKVQTAAANAYRSAGRPADAEPHTRQALAIDPKDNSPLFDLGLGVHGHEAVRPRHARLPRAALARAGLRRRQALVPLRALPRLQYARRSHGAVRAARATNGGVS